MSKEMDVVQLLELSTADPRRVTVEATVTTGFESVAISEFREMFENNSEACRSRGRIYFNVADSDISKVLSMRSVDNVYVVAHATSSMGFVADDSEKDLQMIFDYAKKPDWDKVFAVWKASVDYRGIFYPTKDQYSCSYLLEQELLKKARIIGAERYEKSKLTKAVNSGDRPVQPGDDLAEDISGVPSQLSNENTHLKSDVTSQLSDVNIIKNSDEPSQPVDENIDPNSKVPSQRSDKTTNHKKAKSAGSANKGTASGKLQRRSEMEQACLNTFVTRAYNRIDERPPGEKVLKYRVTCYRRGKNSFGSQDAAEKFGGQLQDLFQWIVDLERFDLEIVLNIRSDKACASVALTTESKHHRNISHFGPTTLRATVCYNLLRLGQPRVGDIIVDPLCGGGSIPIEGALGWAGTYHVGGDSHPKAMVRAAGNLRDVSPSPGNRVDIVAWDATNLPLRDGSVDLFVSDLPFGRRSGSKKDNRVLYLEVLRELARVVRREGGRAVLLTEDKRSFTKAVPLVRGLWTLNRTLSVNIGGLEAAAYVLSRSK